MLPFLLLAAAFAGPPGTIKGLSFGTQCSDRADFVLFKIEGDGDRQLSVYTRTPADLDFVNVPVLSVHYLCWRDRFLRAHIEVASPQAVPLYYVLETAWGLPERLDAGVYAWLSYEADSYAQLSAADTHFVLGIMSVSLTEEFMRVNGL